MNKWKRWCVAVIMGAALSLAFAAWAPLPGTPAVVRAAGEVAIQSCRIDDGGQTVTVTAKASGTPSSDDGQYYLFAEPMYSGSLSTPVASAAMGNDIRFTVDLKARQAGSHLNHHFTIAVKQGSAYVPVSGTSYITNPEAVATSTVARKVTASKKGLLVDPAKLGNSELKELGVKHAAYNIFVANILGETTHSGYPTIHYNYNGKDWQFNGQAIAEYDYVFKTLSDQGIVISVVLANNNSNGKFPYLVHPYSRDAAADYYAFNTAEKAGVECLEAVASFLAQRYSNKGFGQIDNWIVGNEVTARTQWNYMSNVGFDTYVAEYANAVRLFYNGIKSENANANVHINIDQQWDRNRNDPNNYDGRDLLIALNQGMKASGDINWGVSCHPYPVPLTVGPYWLSGAYYRNLVNHSTNTPMLTMENIEVLTDFMCTVSMRAPGGVVRPIIVSGVGYVSAQGEAEQAAAFVHAYLQAANNQYITEFILSRQTETADEIAQGLPVGIRNPDGTPKLIYDYYKYIDTDKAGPYMDAAKATMGIADWSQVLTPR